VTPAPRSGAIVRSYTPLPLALGSPVPPWQHPRLLATLGVVLAVAAVTAAMVGSQLPRPAGDPRRPGRGRERAGRHRLRARTAGRHAGSPLAGDGRLRCNGGADGTGVTLVVRNVLTPPIEAVALIETLRRTGALAVGGHKPDLPDDRQIEIRIGRLR
jgi:hypothetical protein